MQSDTLSFGQAPERPSPDARPALRLGLAPACALEFAPKEGSSSAVTQSVKTQGHMPVAGITAEGANADARLTVQSDVAAACKGVSEQHRSTAAVQSPAVARQSPHHQQLPPMHAQQDRDLIPGAPQTGREGHQMEPGSFQAPEKSARDAAASHFSKPSKQVAAEQMLPVKWQGEFPATATSVAIPRASQPSDAPPESLEPAQSLQHQNFRITRIAGARSISAVQDTAALDLSNVGSGISPGSSSSGQGASQHHLMESLLLGGLSDSAACSIPWRTKRKAVCLEPAQSCIPHAQVDVPQKRGAVTQHVPVSGCQASESASERAHVTCQLQTPCPLQSPAPEGSTGGLSTQIGEQTVKTSQELPMPAPTSNATDLAKEPPQQAADGNKGQVSTDPSQPVFSALPSASANDLLDSPAWMAEQVRALAEKCTAAPLPDNWETGGLIGRSVGFMLLEDFDAGGQTISCGIKTGRFDPCCYSELPCPAPEILERWTLPDAANDSHCHSEVDVMGAGCLNMSLMAILRTSAAAPHARCSTAFILCD